MAGKYHWNPKITKQLIEEYRRNDILYNSRHPDYKNREKRFKVYQHILHNINRLQNGLDIKDLKRKINGLRSQYLSEKIKIIRSQKSESDTNSIYTPSVYWYSSMQFIDADAPIFNLYGDYGSTEASFKLEPIMDETSNLESSNSCSIQEMETAQTLTENKIEPPNSETKPTTVPLATTNDEFDIFGKFIASELREIKNVSDQIVYRQTKRQIQRVLLNMWDSIESTPRASRNQSFLSDSSIVVDDDSSSLALFNHIKKETFE